MSLNRGLRGIYISGMGQLSGVGRMGGDILCWIKRGGDSDCKYHLPQKAKHIGLFFYMVRADTALPGLVGSK
jgi:hypothetical protein